MRNISLYIDLVFCLLVLPAMAAIFPVERWWHNFGWYVLTAMIWLYAVYFVNRVVTVPCLFSGKTRKLTGLLLFVLSIVGTYVLSSIQLYTPKPCVFDVGIERVLPNVNQYQQAVWSLFVIVEAFSCAVGLLTQVNEQRSRRREVESERDRAEIELYKAQIKPHFMFNTLNSLYGLFLTGDPKALTSLEKFIGMMQYLHENTLRDWISIKDEAEYIRLYVELQSLRLSKMTEVSLDIDIEDESLRVPPMLLVTFVENCFKHGVSPAERSTIYISLTEKDGKLAFSTSNRIFPVKRIGEHLGIGNCRKRLNLLYPGRHELVTEPKGDHYIVELKINLTAC